MDYASIGDIPCRAGTFASTSKSSYPQTLLIWLPDTVKEEMPKSRKQSRQRSGDGNGGRAIHVKKTIRLSYNGCKTQLFPSICEDTMDCHFA